MTSRYETRLALAAAAASGLISSLRSMQASVSVLDYLAEWVEAPDKAAGKAEPTAPGGVVVADFEQGAQRGH